MPNYPGNALAALLYENAQQYFWNDETVAAGTLSVAWELRRTRGASYPWGLSVEVVFSGDPGTFEIDVMGANLDNQQNYLQIGSITNASGSTVAGAFVGRLDMPSNVWPKYVAAYIKTLTNAVRTTLQVTR